jgi:hypothetical protein
MINGKVSVSGTDRSGTLKKLLDGISRMEVYVGIPEEKADREGGGPSNAQLAFIHTHGARAASMRREMAGEMDKGQSYSAAHQLYVSAHGSPLYRVPPRPIIEPAIEAEGNKEPIAEELGAAAKAVLDRKPAEAKRHLTKAGMLGQNAANVEIINDIDTDLVTLYRVVQNHLAEFVRYLPAAELLAMNFGPVPRNQTLFD